MKQTLFAQQQQSVKTDPRIKMFTRLLVLYWLLCAFEWFIAIGRIFTGVGPIDALGQFSFLFFFNTFGPPVLWTAAAILYMFIVRIWKRFDLKRQAAAQGDQSMLAIEQPRPDAQALSLPLTIRMRSNRRLQLTVMATLFLSLMLPFIGGFAFGLLGNPTHPLYLEVWFIIIGVWALFALVLVGIMYLLLYIKGREQVTLTDYGIMLSGVTPRIHSIPWSEARLFAIVNPYSPKRGRDRQPLLLEVASEHELVRWVWLRPTSPRSGFIVPVLPPEEYEQQMRNVLSVIAAKTGLPLYDLRKR
jgi:hypothetical protein